MARYCETCIAAICDHCKWYDFNGDEAGCYSGAGYCRFWREPRDPLDECEHYECVTLKQGDPGFDRPAGQRQP
jgi:hypothetical protein